MSETEMQSHISLNYASITLNVKINDTQYI